MEKKGGIGLALRVRELNKDAMGSRVFAGLECDSMGEGNMDIADEALSELDVVIGSVHSDMNLEPAEMTDRLLAAI